MCPDSLEPAKDASNPTVVRLLLLSFLKHIMKEVKDERAIHRNLTRFVICYSSRQFLDYSTHIFSEIVKELPIPVFSLAFTESWGTLTLGGPDPMLHSKPITWINTLKGEAGWATHLSSRIDIYAKVTDPKSTPDSETDYVQTNLDRVWFDSGTTYIWGDERTVTPLNDWMGADPVTGQINCSTIPSLGTIVFSIGGNEESPLLRLELSPAEYIIGKPTSHRCFTALNVAASSKNHWIFGLHVLRAFYTVYHYEYGLVGIGKCCWRHFLLSNATELFNEL